MCVVTEMTTVLIQFALVLILWSRKLIQDSEIGIMILQYYTAKLLIFIDSSSLSLLE